MISGRTQLVAHLGYPTESFTAPMIYDVAVSERTSMEAQDRSEDREPRSKHDAHADRNPQCLVVHLSPQAVDRCGEVVAGHQFGHDELPCRFGLRLGMILGYAMFAQILAYPSVSKAKATYPSHMGALA